MANQVELLVEAERRGILPVDKKALLDEARKRGLLGRAPIGTGRPKQTLAVEGSRKGSFLPLSTDPEGNLQFDPSAGIMGSIGRALSLPGDVVTGKVSPADIGAVPGAPGDPATMGRMFNLAGIATPVNPAVRAGDLAIPGVKTNLTRPQPTSQQVLQAGSQGMTQARNIPVDFSPEAVRTLSRNIEVSLNERGLPQQLVPDVHATLKQLQGIPDEAVAVTGNNLISIRQSFQNIADGASKTMGTDRKSGQEFTAAVSAIRALDEFIGRPPSEGVVSGPAGAFAKTYETARQNISAAKRSQLLEKKEAIADWRAASAGSGQNLGNTLRQRLTDVLAKNEMSGGAVLRGWTAEERAALEQIVNGTGGMNAWRSISNRLGGGRGLGQTGLAAGGAALGSTFGPLGAAIGAVTPVVAGTASRSVYNNMVSKAVDQLENLLLRRSPQYEGASATVAGNPRALMNSLRSILQLPQNEDQQ